jgi:hypothetical protein
VRTTPRGVGPGPGEQPGHQIVLGTGAAQGVDSDVGQARVGGGAGRMAW